MKTLKESLFDADLDKRDLKFGDVYKPVELRCTNYRAIKSIENLFSMSKLRKIGKRVDLTAIKTSFWGTSSIEVIELITGIIMDMSLKDDNKYYGNEIEKIFKPLARQPLWRRSIYITLAKQPYNHNYYDDYYELCIDKSTMTESIHIKVYFEKI